MVFTECFFAILCAHIRHGGTWAYYAPGFDRIQMPTFEAFRSGVAYYGTLAHEDTHWTAHASR